jgi:hypothetical protein
MPDMTNAGWRARRNVSKSSHYKLKVLGLAPDEYNVPGTRLTRITEEADAAWELRMRQLAKSETARLEAERRRELAAVAGRIAAESPLHVTRRRAEPLRKRQPPRRSVRARKPAS